MTREEAQAWVASLKPGDTVIRNEWDNRFFKETAKKVTPSGIVRTDSGRSFKLSNWSNCVNERGGRNGEIAPATEELLQEAERQEQRRREEMDRVRAIRRAVSEMSCANTGNVPYEFAADFLDLCKKHGVSFDR